MYEVFSIGAIEKQILRQRGRKKAKVSLFFRERNKWLRESAYFRKNELKLFKAI